MPTYRITDKKTGAVVGVHVLGEGVQRSPEQITAQAAAGGLKAIEVELVPDEEAGKPPRRGRAGDASGGGGATAGAGAKARRRAPEVRFDRG